MMRNFLFVVLAACATDPTSCPECGDDDGKADGTDPTGGTGTITVTVPAGTSPSAKLVAQRVGGGPRLELEAGSPRAVSEGTYCVHVELPSVSLPSFETHGDCSVVVANLAHVTYALGAVQFTHGTQDLVWGIDVNATTSIARDFLSRTDIIPHPAGDHVYAFGDGDARAQVFHVDAGETTTADLTDAAHRHAIRLLPSTGRTLPNGADTSVSVNVCSLLGGFFADCASYFILEQPVLFFGNSAAEGVSYPAFGMFHFASAVTTTEVQLRRLDLNHVRVTLADGSLDIVPGFADIFAVAGNGAVSRVGQSPTGFGFDLAAGKYRVTTSYTHPVDGSSNAVTQDIELH